MNDRKRIFDEIEELAKAKGEITDRLRSWQKKLPEIIANFISTSVLDNKSDDLRVRVYDGMLIKMPIDSDMMSILDYAVFLDKASDFLDYVWLEELFSYLMKFGFTQEMIFCYIRKNNEVVIDVYVDFGVKQEIKNDSLADLWTQRVRKARERRGDFLSLLKDLRGEVLNCFKKGKEELELWMVDDCDFDIISTPNSKDEHFNMSGYKFTKDFFSGSIPDKITLFLKDQGLFECLSMSGADANGRKKMLLDLKKLGRMVSNSLEKRKEEATNKEKSTKVEYYDQEDTGYKSPFESSFPNW